MATATSFDWCELSHAEKIEIDALIKVAAGTTLFPGGKLLVARQKAHDLLTRVKRGQSTTTDALKMLRKETAVLLSRQSTR